MDTQITQNRPDLLDRIKNISKILKALPYDVGKEIVIGFSKIKEKLKPR